MSPMICDITLISSMKALICYSLDKDANYISNFHYVPCLKIILIRFYNINCFVCKCH